MTEEKFREIYPPEIIELMLQRQEEQGNPKSIEPFLEDVRAGKTQGAFTWRDTFEGHDFWDKVLRRKKFAVFYKKYPKTNNNILILL